MRSLYFILCVICIVSCVNRTSTTQSVYPELYSLDLQSPKLADDCYYLKIFEEMCFGDIESQLDFRLLIRERNKGTRIMSIFDINNRYLIVKKSIEPGYDNLFTIITENLPIQYSVQRTIVSKEKYTTWKSNFLDHIYSDDAIITSHDRTVLKATYMREGNVERIEARGDFKEEIDSLLRSIKISE